MRLLVGMTAAIILWGSLTMGLQGEPPASMALAGLYIAPALGVKVLQGHVDAGEIVYCHVSTEQHQWADHGDEVITFECEGGVKLELGDVVFDPEQKVAMHILRVSK